MLWAGIKNLFFEKLKSHALAKFSLIRIDVEANS